MSRSCAARITTPAVINLLVKNLTSVVNLQDLLQSIILFIILSKLNKTDAV